MKWMVLAMAALTLSACGAPMQLLADHYNQQDPCQARRELGRPQGYQRPNFCGAAGNRATIYNLDGRAVGFIRL